MLFIKIVAISFLVLALLHLFKWWTTKDFKHQVCTTLFSTAATLVALIGWYIK